MRLIDADAFLDWLDVGHLRNPGEVCFCEADVMHMIKSRQTVDTVPAVRCCDCRYFTEHMEVGMCKRIADKPILPINYDAFCSYGERKEEEK